jgi:hypothetical protein
MVEKYIYKLIENPKELAKFGFWSEEIYEDLLACQKGKMSKDLFNAKYLSQIAILCLDTAGFTKAAMKKGELYSLFRAMGSEMNRASKLGEDIAGGEEILVTEHAFEVLKDRDDCTFRKRIYEEVSFTFYEVLLK